jgi:tetratricopeptide (TPR) repeat protein
MTTRTKTLVMLAMVSLLTGVACSKVKARAALKDGNKLYKEENYRKALEEYQRSVDSEASAEGYFYLGSSHQNLFRPTKLEDPENRAHLDKAVECYLKTLELVAPGNEAHARIRMNALGALTGIYSEPPFEAFDKALGYAQELTKDNPEDAKNLYAIANLYEKFSRVADAEATYRKITDAHPEDVKACGALATFYNKTYWDADGSIWTADSKKPKRSRFKDSVTTLEKCTTVDPSDPTGFFKVASFYWNAAYRDADLTEKQKDEYADLGLAAIEKALTIKPDYWEAVIYKGLLYRVKATLTRDPKKRGELIEQATKLQKLALDLRKEQQASDKELPPEAQGSEGGTGEAPAEAKK